MTDHDLPNTQPPVPVNGPSASITESAATTEQHRDYGGGQPHSFRGAKHSQGFGHDVTNRKGGLRMSGNPGAHCIGSKKR